MVRKPSVCLLLESYLPVKGGMERGAYMLSQALVAKGCEVTILTRRVDENSPLLEMSPVGTIVRTGPVGTASRLRWIHMFTCVPALIRLRHQYEVLWVGGFRVLGLPAVITALLLGKRSVLRAESCGEMDGSFFLNCLSDHGVFVKCVRLLLRAWIYSRNLVLRRASQFVAISTEIRDEFLACHVPDSKVEIIHQSVDTHAFSPVESAAAKRHLREQLSLPIGACIFCFTGRLVSYKGLPTLLSAWKGLPASVRSQSHLLIVGEGGHDVFNCEQSLRDYVAESQLSTSVTFSGGVDNVVDYLRASDVFVFPTENEAFGISIIEAMSVGLPTISTLAGGVRDIVDVDKTGLTVEIGDADSLRDSIEALWQSPDLREQLGLAGRRRVESLFSQSAMGDSCYRLIV